ncbi:MAG: NAD(P)-dependent oxidoreductase [Verrucomicrobiales bacterium]|nr:NAD(P)-dependent oxidoreductase [Verrucomicrobiales bacterium]
MSRVLVVGNRSLVGRAVGRFLGDAGFSVTWAGRSEADVLFDVSAPFCLPHGLSGIEAVVMVAGDFGGATGEDFERAEKVNAIGALNVCRLAEAIGARHVTLVSSISATYRPGDPYFGSYALTKRHGEELADLFCDQKGLPLAVLRPTQIYDDAGAGRRHQGLLYAVIDRAEAGETIEFFGSHDARRNFLHVDDFAEIVARSVARGLEGVYDCPHPESVRLSHLGRTALEVFGQGGEIRFLPDRSDLPDVPDVSGEALYDAVGYRPVIDLAEGIRRIKRHREEAMA